MGKKEEKIRQFLKGDQKASEEGHGTPQWGLGTGGKVPGGKGRRSTAGKRGELVEF